MPRFSIFHAMAVVGVVAANCAAIRAVMPSNGGWDGFYIIVVGLLPLLDAQIIGLYLVISRYGISLRRRTRQERVGVAPPFVAANALALLAAITACVMAPAGVMPYLEFVLWPVEMCCRSMGFQNGDFDSPFFRFFGIPLLVGAALSGPPLMVALLVGWVSSRYKLVVVSRPGPAMPRETAVADSGEAENPRMEHQIN
jgi:hypothetical protein